MNLFYMIIYLPVVWQCASNICNTLQQLNQRIHEFSFGSSECKNRPSEIANHHLSPSGGLKQSGQLYIYVGGIFFSVLKSCTLQDHWHQKCTTWFICHHGWKGNTASHYSGDYVHVKWGCMGIIWSNLVFKYFIRYTKALTTPYLST